MAVRWNRECLWYNCTKTDLQSIGGGAVKLTEEDSLLTFFTTVVMWNLSFSALGCFLGFIHDSCLSKGSKMYFMITLYSLDFVVGWSWVLYPWGNGMGASVWNYTGRIQWLFENEAILLCKGTGEDVGKCVCDLWGRCLWDSTLNIQLRGTCRSNSL